jgi:hypothetical protein
VLRGSLRTRRRTHQAPSCRGSSPQGEPRSTTRATAAEANADATADAQFPRERAQALEARCNHSMVRHGGAFCNPARSFGAAGAIASVPARVQENDRRCSWFPTRHRRSFCPRQSIHSVRIRLARRLFLHPNRPIYPRMKEDMGRGRSTKANPAICCGARESAKP